MLVIRLLLVTGAVLGLAGCESPSASSAESGLPSFTKSPEAVASSVTGSARIDLSAWGLPPESYNFNVLKDGSGQVRGKVAIALSDPEAILDVEPSCLQVGGNLAWVEGSVTKSNSAIIPVGTTIFLRVRDNGEGANAQPDAISFVFFGAFVAGRCDARFGTGTPWPMYGGNIQVR